MSKPGMIKSAFRFLILFIIMISIAACGGEKTADNLSAPISSTTISASPTSTVPSESEQPSADNQPNTTPEESTSKADTTIESAQPAHTSTPVPSIQANSSLPPVSPSVTKEPDAAKGISLSITGDDKTGVILDATLVEVKGEVSVLALLQKATREKKIQMEFSGKGIFAYVKGISNLYEFDRGAKSGWLFKVNGAFSEKGAGAYKVKAGDQVEWLYTLNLGKDIGAKP